MSHWISTTAWTLNGGPLYLGYPYAGYVEGNPVSSTDAQFHTPIGLALDSTGNLLYVADRVYRVVYTGTLTRGAAGAPWGARLDRVFVVPGANRAGKSRSDWRDTGPGISGLVSIPGTRRAEDLFVLERQGFSPNHALVWRMDRFGQAGTWMGVSFPEGPEADDGQLDLERVALHLARDRAHEGQADLAVVRGGRQHDGRPSARLLVTRSRVHRDPDDVPPVRDARHATRPPYPVQAPRPPRRGCWPR